MVEKFMESSRHLLIESHRRELLSRGIFSMDGNDEDYTVILQTWDAKKRYAKYRVLGVVVRW